MLIQGKSTTKRKDKGKSYAEGFTPDMEGRLILGTAKTPTYKRAISRGKTKSLMRGVRKAARRAPT